MKKYTQKIELSDIPKYKIFNNITKQRRHANMSIDDLANMLNISVDELTMIESNKNEFNYSLEFAMTLSVIFNVFIDDIFFYVDDDNRIPC